MHSDRRLVFSYPKEGTEFQRALIETMAKIIALRNPFVSESNSLHYSHGRRWRHHAAADTSESEMTRHSVEAEISSDDIIGQDPIHLQNFIAGIGGNIADAMFDQAMRVLTEGAESVGNVVDARGRSFDAEVYLEMLGKMDFAVNKSDGTASEPTVMLPPEHFKAMKALSEAGDAAFEARLDAIVKKKSEEALERERQRKAKFKNGDRS